MVEDENYGITIAMKNNHAGENKLKDVAGKSRLVPREPRHAGGGPPHGHQHGLKIHKRRTSQYGPAGAISPLLSAIK